MRIAFSIRGNGACPLCIKEKDCLIRDNLSRSVAAFKDKTAGGMEVVIYACPFFVEKS